MPDTQPPSPFRFQDKVSVGSPVVWRFPTWGVAAQGTTIAVTNASESISADTVSLLNSISGELLREFSLPDGCEPRGLDTQGDLCAVTCWGLERVVFFSITTGQEIGAKGGINVGKNPIDVRISGNIVAIVNHGSDNVSFIRLDRLTEFPQQVNVGKSPIAISALNGQFFVRTV